MWIDFKNSFTFAFKEKLQKAAEKSTISPQICCRTTLEALNV